MTTSGSRARDWVCGPTSVATWTPMARTATSGTASPRCCWTTTGRRSGRSTTTPLIYGRQGDQYIVVASKGGAPRHPDWYLNLSDQPEVGLQVAADRFAAQARTAGPEEKEAAWAIMTEVWPAYDEYQVRTSRVIPVVILETRPVAGEWLQRPDVPADAGSLQATLQGRYAGNGRQETVGKASEILDFTWVRSGPWATRWLAILGADIVKVGVAGARAGHVYGPGSSQVTSGQRPPASRPASTAVVTSATPIP